MAKYIISGIILIILAVGGGYYLQNKNTIASAPVPVIEQPQPFVASTSTYASSSYSIVYPNEFIKNENYVNDAFGPKKLIHGVQFTISESMATGTNLAMSDTGVSVEQLPRAQKCSGDIYLKENVKAQTVNENGVEYSLATTTREVGGAVVEEMVYTLTASKPCTALRYRITLLDLGPAATSTREYDRTALLKEFDSIRFSLKLAQ